MLGTVKWFSVDRDYGFIVCDDGSEDAFVGGRTLRCCGVEYLRDGERVTFDVKIGSRGKPEAVNVAVVGGR
jgi:CspA family cold shock protein